MNGKPHGSSTQRKGLESQSRPLASEGSAASHCGTPRVMAIQATCSDALIAM